MGGRAGLSAGRSQLSGGFLVDSHVLMWLAQDPPRLSARVVGVLEESETPLFVSTAGIAELCIKAGLGKLQLPWAGEDPVLGFEDLLANLEIDPLPVTLAHAARLRDLPLHHRDPFDRLMIAQAMVEGLTFVTHDRAVASYDGLAVLWA